MASASSQPYPTDGAGSVGQAIPSYTLYDPTSVGVAAFLGSAIAGTALMAINYRRLGKAGQAVWTLVIGVAATGLTIGFGKWIPSWATTAVGLTLFLGTYNAAKYLQGATVTRHEQLGGKVGSRWIAVGFGLIVLAAWAAIFLFSLGQSRKVTIGSRDSVYYAGSATKQDAQALGDKLKAVGFFTDRGATVLLSKGNDGTVVSFVVQDGAWNQPEMVAGFEEVGREIAPSIGGFPITVRLVNIAQQTKKEVTVGRVPVGTKDNVYYFGSATASDATALGNALRTATYFRDSGADVFLTKDDSGTTLSFVVAQGLWDDQQAVAECQAMVRKAVAPVLGVPITVRLLNTGLETKKTVVVSSLKPTS